MDLPIGIFLSRITDETRRYHFKLGTELAPGTLFWEPGFSASIDDEEFRSGRGRGAVRGIAVANVVALAWLQAELLAIAQHDI